MNLTSFMNQMYFYFCVIQEGLICVAFYLVWQINFEGWGRLGQWIEEADFVICFLDNPLTIAGFSKVFLLLLLTEDAKHKLEV